MTEQELAGELRALMSNGTSELRRRFDAYRSSVIELANKLEFQANSALKPKGQSVKFRWNWTQQPQGVRFLELAGSGRSDPGAKTLLSQFGTEAAAAASRFRDEANRATERYQSAASQLVAGSGLGGRVQVSVLWMNQQAGPNTPRMQFKRNR
ncbi:MAG TPA: hypothetical protein PLR76_09945 [Hyphomonas sp.]|nr:hypothetical protein [Hyphomonas sp.]